MAALWNSAIALLLITGGFLGLTLPFGKLATNAGFAAPAWALVISGGGGLVLLAALLASGRGVGLAPHKLRYYAITAAISYAIPNILIFMVIPHLGAGYTGILFTLSPVITLMLSLVLGIRRPSALGIAGIVVGFAGAMLVALTRGEAGRPAEFLWVGLGLLIPLSLAAGNIYRTADWPKDAGPIELAAGSNLVSALMLLGLMVVMFGAPPLGPVAGNIGLTLAQVAASAGMFVFFFRLQSVGGPVYLSQIGYVAAAIGLASGTIFLGERYLLLTWLGAVIVGAGVALTTKAQATPPATRSAAKA